MAKHLNQEQRRSVAEKIMEWGNLVFAGTVIVQFVAADVDTIVALGGVLMFAFAYGLALRYMRGGE